MALSSTFSRRFWHTCAVLLFSACFLMLITNKAFSQCDQDKGIGAVFYNFETLFIYYADFPHQTDEKLSGFPAPLKYDNFNKRLLEAVRKNFGACLKTALGTEKPIVVIPPPTMRGGV